MNTVTLSGVEKAFFERSGRNVWTTKIPYLVVSNFPELGFLTALRFLEWAAQNPEGIISLPTGKTPEYFIKWTKLLLDGWNVPANQKLMNDNGLVIARKPSLSGLRFVQIDEFYPIHPSQHNSFCNYVVKYYIENFGLDSSRALLINSEEIQLFEGRHYSNVFPDGNIDLSLRNREPLNATERCQQSSIFMIDNWCTEYENRIRDLGGIGFFLGGIGPDGHIAFNTRGSDHNSATRLTATNFETQAAAASDLGGIEISRNRKVITIGLGTLTQNREGVSIIFAAGESKAHVVRNALENSPDNLYPGTVLQRQNASRFYLTEGAASQLSDSIERYYTEGAWTEEKSERAIYDLCVRINKYATRLEEEDLRSDGYCSMIPGISLRKVNDVIESTKLKIARGMKKESSTTFLHTGPHHDDIMLGIFPAIIPQLRIHSNKFHFAVLTSGFTSVSNNLMIKLLKDCLRHIDEEKIGMLNYPDFFEKGYTFKFHKDVSHYLDKLADRDEAGMIRGVCHRLIRVMVGIYSLGSREDLTDRIRQNIALLENSYSGKKDPPDIQKLKGMLREFEEELVWAHYGVKIQNIEHMRLGFYTGDLFTPQPEGQRDVEPVLDLLRRVQPDVISLAFDPEGAGPDTHYKVLQAIAQALREWQKERDISLIRIIGYRNVWYKFHPSEANVFVPVSLNSMAVLNSSFRNCYISQVEASFPSPDFAGPFSELSQKIWVEQFKRVQLILGKDFFYDNDSPKLRATHGMVFYREMDCETFLKHARELEKSIEGNR